jgi:hypothetical protein
MTVPAVVSSNEVVTSNSNSTEPESYKSTSSNQLIENNSSIANDNDNESNQEGTGSNESLTANNSSESSYQEGTTVPDGDDESQGFIIRKATTPSKIKTRNAASRNTNSEVTTVIHLLDKVHAEQAQDLNSLLNDDNDFVIEDHLINIINTEVVINSLQQRNVNYIHNVMICYLVNNFNPAEANKLSLITYLHKMINDLFKILSKVVKQYNKIFKTANKSKIDYADPSNEFVVKHRKNLKLATECNMDTADLLIHSNDLEISLTRLDKESKSEKEESLSLGYNPKDLKRRIVSVIISIVNFIYDSYVKFQKDNQRQLNEQDPSFFTSFKEFMHQNSNSYSSNLNVNESALAAFRKKIYHQEVSYDFKTLRDVFDVRLVYATKLKSKFFQFLIIIIFNF